MTLRRYLVSLLLLLPLSAFAIPYAPTVENAKDILPGRDYIVLATPLPTSTGNQIEVREFFWYGCPHCFELEHIVVAWLQKKPQDVEFVRTPAVINPVWEIDGRAYFVAEELKVLDKTHAALYNAIHEGGNDALRNNKDEIGRFFAKFGVQQAQFNATWDSFSVNTKIANASQLARKYQISGTPTLTVAGKYVIPAAGDRTFAIVDFLLKKERAARGGK